MIVVEPENIDNIHQAIREALSDGHLKMEELDARCKRALTIRKWSGLNTQEDRSFALRNNPASILLEEEIAKYSLIVSGGGDIHVPIRSIDHVRFAQLSIGQKFKTSFIIASCFHRRH